MSEASPETLARVGLAMIVAAVLALGPGCATMPLVIANRSTVVVVGRGDADARNGVEGGGALSGSVPAGALKP